MAKLEALDPDPIRKILPLPSSQPGGPAAFHTPPSAPGAPHLCRRDPEKGHAARIPAPGVFPPSAGEGRGLPALRVPSPRQFWPFL